MDFCGVLPNYFNTSFWGKGIPDCSCGFQCAQPLVPLRLSPKYNQSFLFSVPSMNVTYRDLKVWSLEMSAGQILFLRLSPLDFCISV